MRALLLDSSERLAARGRDVIRTALGALGGALAGVVGGSTLPPETSPSIGLGVAGVLLALYFRVSKDLRELRDRPDFPVAGG